MQTVLLVAMIRLAFGERTKIKMTNSKWFKEWIKNKIDEMTDDELSEFICYEYAAPKDDMNYKIFAMEWLNQEHQKPMSELKDGVFVEVKLADNNAVLGVVFNNKIILQNGKWCGTKESLAYITKVFDACCFSLCDDCCIWEKE